MSSFNQPIPNVETMPRDSSVSEFRST